MPELRRPKHTARIARRCTTLRLTAADGTSILSRKLVSCIYISTTIEHRTLAVKNAGKTEIRMKHRSHGNISHILSLDVGTTNAKAALFDTDGNELAVRERSFSAFTAEGGKVEQDPEQIWRAVLEVLRGIAGGVLRGIAGEGRRGIAGGVLPGIAAEEPGAKTAGKTGTWSPVIGLSTQGGSLIPADNGGRPVGRMITWMDRRAEAIVDRWKADGTSERIREISGWHPQPGLPITTIRSLFESGSQECLRFLSLNDFLALRLTGNAVTNPSCAGEMLLVDRRSGRWSEELCNIAGISPDRLSGIRASDEEIGTVTAAVAEETGLPGKTAVINGGQDHSCEAFALGMERPGEALLACGTAWVINGVSSSPDLGSVPPAMDLNFHVVPGTWMVSQFLGSFGAGLDWCMRQCYGDAGEMEPGAANDTARGTADESAHGEPAYRELEKEVEGVLSHSSASYPGARHPLFIPLSGSAHAAGLPPNGETATCGGFWGLTQHHERAHMALAVMEGAAMELRWAMENLKRAGFSFESLWMVGGAVRNRHWPQIVADATDIPVRTIDYSHGPALGAALLAGLGSGIFTSPQEAHSRFAVNYRETQPETARRRDYDGLFDSYRQFVEAVSSI